MNKTEPIKNPELQIPQSKGSWLTNTWIPHPENPTQNINKSHTYAIITK